MEKQSKEMIERLGNPFISFIFLTLISATLLHFISEAGKIIIVIIIAFFVAEIITRLFTGGHKGAFHSPVFGAMARKKGHAYIIFYITIIIATILGEYIAREILRDFISPSLYSFGNELIVAGVFSALIVLYVEFTYYGAEKKPAHVREY